MIRIPKKTFPGTTRLMYPTPVGEWSNTFIDGDFVVGDCASALYLVDGITKAFEWENYEKPPVNYGTLISSLAFFDRMHPIEETFFRTQAKTNVEFEKLLARAERLSGAIELTRTDVRNGIAAVLNAMVHFDVEGYTQEFADFRFAELVDTPVVWDELPTDLKTTFSGAL